MLIRKPDEVPSSAITPKEQYLNRRRFLRGAARTALGAGVAALGAARLAEMLAPRTAVEAGAKLATVHSPLTTTGEPLTSYQDVTHYNNFYEFGVDKSLPAQNAGRLPRHHQNRSPRRQTVQGGDRPRARPSSGRMQTVTTVEDRPRARRSQVPPGWFWAGRL